MTDRPRNQALYAFNIFISAFLLFEVQPLVAKEILPWFGGSAGVWATCMLFFQVLLLAGYAYAHALSRSRRAWIHGPVLALSLMMCRIIPLSALRPTDSGDPVLRILIVLVCTIGVPYFSLAATSPLLQTWYAREHQGRVPYRFFALSNLGSMLALLSYPILVEPQMNLRTQAWTWSGGFILCTVLNGLVFRRSGAAAALPTVPEPVVEPAALARRDAILWIVLPACASALLLAVTNHLTQNIAAIPLLWVLPLGAYLLSFILTFDAQRWYQRPVLLPLLALAALVMGYVAAESSGVDRMKILIPVFIGGLFICCMVCHGELVRVRPGAQRLTTFYLLIAVGGAAGGLFVSIIAPLVFPLLLELPLLLVITPAVILVTLLSERAPERRGPRFWRAWTVALIGLLALGGYLAKDEWGYFIEARLLSRNFYGALRVADDDEEGVRELSHGTISHGEQYLDPAKQHRPLTYYSPDTGIGRLMKDLEGTPPLRLGVIGLGAGTMAAWGRAGDVVKFYELNQGVIDIARTQFSYLRNCPCSTEVVLGDARFALEHEASQRFDVLVVDAFSGDSIPVHLLTQQAFELYFRHLKPGGILAVHVSNSYLNLPAPVAALARHLGREAHLIQNEEDDATRTDPADWILMGDHVSARHPWIARSESVISLPAGLRIWTDDFSNLWQILRL